MRATYIAAVIVVLAACGTSQPTPTAMTDAFDDAVVQATSEIEAHRGNLARARTMEAVRLEAARHAVEVEGLFEELRAYLGTLDGCDDPGRVYLWSVMNGLEATERGYQLDLEHT